jgi:hypothetical protein
MKPTPKQLLLIVALAVIAGAFLIAQTLTTGTPGSVTTEGSRITRIMTDARADSAAEFPIRLLEGGDAAHESVHIFEAIEGIMGIERATLDTERLLLTVDYDSAAMTADYIRSALVSSGYLVLTAADATPMELAEDGSVQRIEVADEGGFKPAFIRAKAGVPAEIVFDPGTECRVTVKFPQLGITEDISQGATVALPAMEPGTYDILCGGDGSEGTIIVE